MRVIIWVAFGTKPVLRRERYGVGAVRAGSGRAGESSGAVAVVHERHAARQGAALGEAGSGRTGSCNAEGTGHAYRESRVIGARDRR